MAKRGRPKKNLDYNLIKALSERHCTQEEIALKCEVSVRTLQRDREFRRIYEKNRALAKIALRTKQWELAMAGNASMLQLLGREVLGQGGLSDMKHSGEIKINIIDNAKQKAKKEE